MFDLKKGDMVLIPSENSSMIAFGIITEEFYTVNTSVPTIALKKNPKCPFKKRIKIKWIKLLGKESFDPYMRMLMFAHSTVSNINEYKDNINRILYPIYVIGDKIHFTYEIKSEDNISFSAFSNFLNIISSSLDEFDKITGTISSNANISVKTSLNSPGVVEIIGLIFAGGFALAVINAFLFGGKFDTSILAIGKFSMEAPGLLGTILKFIQEKNKNNAELQKLEKDYKIQQRFLKMKTPNENHIDSNDDSTPNN